MIIVLVLSIIVSLIALIIAFWIKNSFLHIVWISAAFFSGWQGVNQFLFKYPRYYLYFHDYWQDYWSFFCFFFFLSWWIVYYHLEKKMSLKEYLTGWSALRGKNIAKFNPRVQNAYFNKSFSFMAMQGILIAVVAFFLRIILQHRNTLQNRNELTPYQEILYPLILIFACLTVIFLIISLDIFDTAGNLFRKKKNSTDPDDLGQINIQKYFYERGVNRAYLGYISLLCFLILSLAFFHWTLPGLAVGILMWFGYSYWLRCEEDQIKKTPTPMNDPLLPQIGGALFILLTFIFLILRAFI